jgi:hypothetical protein
MEITQQNFRIDAALRAALKAGTISAEDYSSACRRITDGENVAKQLKPEQIIKLANESSATCTSREWLFEQDHLVAFASAIRAARQ